MSYIQAIKKLEEELEQEKFLAKTGKITGPLMNTPGAMQKFMLSTAGLRMAALTQHNAIGEMAGMGLLGSIPVQALTKGVGDTKRRVEAQAIRESGHRGEGYNTADLVKLANISSSNMSERSGNLRNVLLAASALSGNPLLHGAATASWMGSNVTRGPLSALSTIGGLGVAAGSKLGISGLGHASNPIMNAMALMPGLVGGVGAGALHTAGGLANLVGASTIGGGLHGAASGLFGAGSSLTALGLANPVVAAMVGLPTMLGLGMAKNKLMNYVDEKSSGVQLLRTGKALRPQLIYASQLELQYNHTRMVDKQRDVAGQQGQLKPFEWFALAYLGDIASSNSLLRFMAEQLQRDSTDNSSISANHTQNNLQSHFGYMGARDNDLTKPYSAQDNSDLASIGWGDIGNDRWGEAAKYKMGEKLSKFARWTDIASAAIDPMAYLQGGEHSVFGKLQAYEKQDRFNEVVNKVSSVSGIPTSFLVALETTGTSLANMGETPMDKMISLTGGMYELVRFSAFRLQDIANHIGATDNTSMGVINAMVNETEAKEDTRDRGWGDRFQEWVATSGAANIGAAGLGAALIGGIGGAGMGLAMAGPLAAYYAWQKRKKAKADGELLSSKEAVEDVDVFGNLNPAEGGSFGSGSGGSSFSGIDLLNAMNTLIEYADNIDANVAYIADCIDCDEDGVANRYKKDSIDDDQKKLIEERRKDKQYQAILESADYLKKIYKDVHRMAGCMLCGEEWARAGLGAGGAGAGGEGDSDDDNFLYVDGGDGDKKKKKKKKNKNKNKTKNKKPKKTPKGKWGKFKNFLGDKWAGLKGLGKSAPGAIGGAAKGAGKMLFPLALGMGAYDVYDAFANDGKIDYATMGMAAGAGIGAFFGGVGAVPGAAIGGGIGYLADLFVPRDESPETIAKEKLFDKQKELFERRHVKWFNWLDDGEYIEKNNKLYWIHDNGDVWDVAGNKKISNVKQEANKNPSDRRNRKRVNVIKNGIPQPQASLEGAEEKSRALAAARKASEYLDQKAKAIAGLDPNGNSLNKVDTAEELKVLLDALRKDQQTVGTMSISEQQALRGQINSLIEIIAYGNQGMINTMKAQVAIAKDPVAMQPVLGNS